MIRKRPLRNTRRSFLVYNIDEKCWFKKLKEISSALKVKDEKQLLFSFNDHFVMRLTDSMFEKSNK